MARAAVLCALAVLGARGVRGMFSVHDDVLAFPQYEIRFSNAFVSEDEAAARLASASHPPTTSPGADSGAPAGTEQRRPDGALYELMWLGDQRFLCSVPVVIPPPPMNATEKELSKVEEEKELARATHRGWELLSDLEGKCLYFVSGWWSYSFCHNREIRQFHQLPPQHSNQWPPEEDPETQSYVLGQVSPEKGIKGQKGEGTELQATGELRFLVQKLGGGTTCDLTGKERKIEVQFHCNSHGTDRIGWIKEVSICCYLMVVYTPRLCNDVAFLPPRENRAHGVECQEIMSSQQIHEFYEKEDEQRKTEALGFIEKAAQQTFRTGNKQNNEQDGFGSTDAEDELFLTSHEL